MTEEVLTVPEVAKLLQISAYTVRELARQGSIPGRKIGNQWRFPRQALLDFLLQREEDQSWLAADLDEPLPPFDWGEAGPPKGRPVYLEGQVLMVVEEGDQ